MTRRRKIKPLIPISDAMKRHRDRSKPWRIIDGGGEAYMSAELRKKLGGPNRPLIIKIPPRN